MKTKKILSLLSSAVFAFGAISSGFSHGLFNANALSYGDYLSYEITSEQTVTITDCDETAQNVIIPETIDGYSVTKIGEYAFDDCNLLESVEIPNSVTVIERYAFAYCYALKDLTLPDNLTKIGEYAFDGCEVLNEIDIPSGVTEIGKFAFNNTSWLNAEKAKNPLIIVNNMLVDGTACTGDVVIPDNVTLICDYAFSNCKSLAKVTIPDSVTKIGEYAFFQCKSLTEINIPNGVTEIPRCTFSYCVSLAKVTIPDSVTKIGSKAFNNSLWLRNMQSENPLVIVNNILIDGTTCTGDVIIPNGVTQIADDAFYESKLTSVSIPSGVTEIPSWVFANCRSLTNVTMPDSVTSIGESAFNSCTALKEISIPQGVTQIGRCAFRYCTALKQISIPNSVTSIGEYAFEDCNSLENVYYDDMQENWNLIEIGRTNEPLLNAALHCAAFFSASDTDPIAKFIINVDYNSAGILFDISKYLYVDYTTADGNFSVVDDKNVSAFDIYWGAYESGCVANKFYGEYVFDDIYVDDVFADLSEQAGTTLTYAKNSDLLLNKLYDENGDGICIDQFNFHIAQRGDANLDNIIDAKDASLIAQYSSSIANVSSIADLPTISDNNDTLAKLVADANGDGTIDAKDASLIAKYSANSANISGTSFAENYTEIWALIS